MDDLLSEEFPITTRISTEPWSDPAQDTPFYTQFRGIKNLDLPLWLTQDLQKRDFLVGTVPTFINGAGINLLLNNMLGTNLSSHSVFFFTLGFKILDYWSTRHERYKVILSGLLQRLFLTRFRDNIVPKADHREVKNTQLNFLDQLTQFERKIYLHLERDFLAFHKWRTSTTGNNSATGDLPMMKRQRTK